MLTGYAVKLWETITLNKQNTKEMLLLEFEFVTLSGYKTDLVAVLNLFVCPEDFMWISSALQGKMLEKPGELILQRKSVCFF